MAIESWIPKVIEWYTNNMFYLYGDHHKQRENEVRYFDEICL